MVESRQQRASGRWGSQEEAREQADKIESDGQDPVEAVEREVEFRTPKFMRMRFNWRDDAELQVVHRAEQAVDSVLRRIFPDLFAIKEQVYECARVPEVDGNGEILMDPGTNTPRWRVRPDGFVDEDFTRMTRAQHEHFVMLITTRIIDWRYRANNLWLHAAMARAQFEERFAISFDTPATGTVDARNAIANRDAAEERYHAVYATALSRAADRMVNDMGNLAQRIKDVMSL